MRRPTLKDVALAAGVHPATASRALNPLKKGDVNADTLRRVLRAAESLGYRPNTIAQSLRTSRTRTMGLIVPDLTNPLFPPIVRGADDVLSAHGYGVLIANTDNDAGREKLLVESLVSRNVDGLIVCTAMRDHPLLEDLCRTIPMVLVNRRVDDVNIPSVVPDDAAGIRQAVSYLVQLGHRRIAHLAGPQNTSTGLNRLRAFRHAVIDAEVDDDPSLVIECAQWEEGDGARALRGALDDGLMFTAIVAGNDQLALGCYDVFEEYDIRCPEQVSVIGFNDITYLGKLRPSMTSVRIPQAAMGAEAAHMLLACIEDPGRQLGSVVLPVRLMVRGSTGIPRPQAASA